jgi:hypothetical protein
MAMEEVEREAWIRLAVDAARSPSAWLASAERLKNAADLLWAADELEIARFVSEANRGPAAVTRFRPAPMLHFSFALLMGFAIENLAKGLIVAHDPSVIRDADQMMRWGHIGTELVRQSGTRLSEPEEKVVKRLEIHVRWAGRYPTPVRATHMRYDGTAEPPPASWTTEFNPVADRLYRRMRKRLVRSSKVVAVARTTADENRRKEARPSVLIELEGLRVATEGAVTLFVNDSMPNEPGASCTCLACGCSFTLNRMTVAAVCGCGTLWRNEPRYEAPWQRWVPHVVEYPV